jgi:hypothetical protein
MSTDTIVFVLVILIRLLLPLWIPRFPFPTMVACALIDAGDQSFLAQFTGVDLAEYQTYDKALDVHYLGIAYVSMLRNWVTGDLLAVGACLWYFRLLGVMLFEVTGVRWLLVVFANVFEYFFVAVELHRSTRNPDRLTRRQIAVVVVFIWLVIKIPQEMWIHVAQWDVTDQFKRHVFGVDIDASWVSAVSHRPLITALVALVVIALPFPALLYFRRPRVADWKRTFDADAVAFELGWDPPSRVVRPTAAFGWSFFEKLVLASMIGTVFANILPVFQIKVGQLIIGTVIVIIVNTFVSEALYERGITMRTVRVLYVFMVLANAATVWGFYLLLGGGESKIQLVNTFVFVMLLTLIVVLFDRYRQVSRMRRGPMFILTT